tara:strand:+ start:1336 stop:1743 length:408 start_codon:yes stop_codon:yes gene_type:complete
MGYHSFDLQSAIYTLLSGDSTLDSLVGNNRIYDNVPQTSSYPYVVIGNEIATNQGTKTLDGIEYGIDIDVWSQYRGKKEIKNIMERIYNLLHDQDLTVSGASFVVGQVRQVATLVEADGITRHGILSVSIIVYDS